MHPANLYFWYRYLPHLCAAGVAVLCGRYCLQWNGWMTGLLLVYLAAAAIYCWWQHLLFAIAIELFRREDREP